MPFRALLWMILSTALALLAVSLWVRAIHPMLSANHEAPVATLTATTQAATQGSSTASMPAAQPLDDPSRSLHFLVRGVLMLSFLLICLLLIVGIIATFRETLRFRGGGRTFSSRQSKTTYTDAWRLAGRRVDLPPPSADSPHEAGNDEDGPPPR